MTAVIVGKAVVFRQNDVSTDQIWPGQYANISEPQAMAEHVLEGADKTLKDRFKTVGQVFVTGSSFGCGSSREQAVISLLTAGVKAVVASSVGRIWYRNAVNLALPVLICPGAMDVIQEGQDIVVNLEAGTVTLPGGDVLQGEPVGDFVLNILANGGIKPLMLKKHNGDDAK